MYLSELIGQAVTCRGGEYTIGDVVFTPDGAALAQLILFDEEGEYGIAAEDIASYAPLRLRPDARIVPPAARNNPLQTELVAETGKKLGAIRDLELKNAAVRRIVLTRVLPLGKSRLHVDGARTILIRRPKPAPIVGGPEPKTEGGERETAKIDASVTTQSAPATDLAGEANAPATNAAGEASAPAAKAAGEANAPAATAAEGAHGLAAAPTAASAGGDRAAIRPAPNVFHAVPTTSDAVDASTTSAPAAKAAGEANAPATNTAIDDKEIAATAAEGEQTTSVAKSVSNDDPRREPDGTQPTSVAKSVSNDDPQSAPDAVGVGDLPPIRRAETLPSPAGQSTPEAANISPIRVLRAAPSAPAADGAEEDANAYAPLPAALRERLSELGIAPKPEEMFGFAEYAAPDDDATAVGDETAGDPGAAADAPDTTADADAQPPATPVRDSGASSQPAAPDFDRRDDGAAVVLPGAAQAHSLAPAEAGGKDEPNVTPPYPRQIPARIIADYAFLLGRVVTAKITEAGVTLIPEGELILARTVELARRHGKLFELTLKSRS